MATKTNTKVKGKDKEYDYFRITRVIGHEIVDGKKVPIKKQFLGRSKHEAEDKYKEYVNQAAAEKYAKQIEKDITTLGQRAEDYVNNALKVSQKYSTGTKVRYEKAYSAHVKKADIMDIPAWTVRAADIQEFYNKLDVSQQTLRQIHKFMSAFYKWLVLNDYSSNVLPAVEIPLKPDNSRHDDIVVWTDEEIKAILGGFSSHRLRFMVHLLLYTGMRIGEALALKYGDIDDGVIHVVRQMYLGEIKPPKYNSGRDIPLHADLIRELDLHRKWHKKEMSKNEYRTDYVFTSRTGIPLDHANVRRSLNRQYKRIGIEPKQIHTYRSTFCTQLCRCGVSLEVASKLLGHKSIEVTAKHYALVKTDTQKQAIDMLHY